MVSVKEPQQQSLAWVTVVFEGELGLLRLQARSMARFLPDEAVSELVVVANNPNPSKLAKKIRAFASDYGPHQEKLRIISPAEFFNGPNSIRQAGPALRALARRILRPVRMRRGYNWRGYSGWHIQQAMKIGVARCIDSETIVYLDAKNHLVSMSSANDVITPNGTPKARLERWRDHHDWDQATSAYYDYGWDQSARAYFDLPSVDQDYLLAPTVTPFVCNTKTVRHALDHIESKSGPIEYFFVSGQPRGTEFTLMSAAAAQLKREAEPGLMPFETALRGASNDQLSSIIEKVRNGELRMIGTHRAVLKASPPELIEDVLKLWVDIGLLESSNEAKTFLQNVLPKRA